MKKRVLALILALVMALSLLPMMAAAEGEAQATEPNSAQMQNETEVTPTPEVQETIVPVEEQRTYGSPSGELATITVTSENTRTGATTGKVKIKVDKPCKVYYTVTEENADWPGNPTAEDEESGNFWPYTQVGKDTEHVITVTADGINSFFELDIKDIPTQEKCKVWLITTDENATIDIGKIVNVSIPKFEGQTEPEAPKASVKVYFTFYDGKNYCFPVGRTEITAVEGTAAKYGMENAKAGHLVGGMDHSIKAGQVSVLDALLCAHEAVYGAAFTKDTMSSYFGGSSSFVSKIFGVDGNISYAVNDRLPVGPKYDGYAINEYALSEGDDVYFFIYASPSWGDYLSYFDKKQLTVNAGEEITLKLSGYMAMEQMDPEGSNTKPLETLENIEGAEIDLLDENAGKLKFGDYLGKTDENGKVKLKFDKAGTYYVSAIGASSKGSRYPITGPWCEITVNEAKPGESDLNGMLVYNGTVANDTTVILKNADDSYTTTNVFEWNKYEYDLGTVTDSSNQLRFKLKLPTGAKATLHYTDLNGNPATKDATNSSNGAWINCLRPGKNTVKVVVAPPAGSTATEKTYTINVNCQPSLTALALSANGNEAYLNPAFKNSVYDYSADISAAIETVLVTATPKDASCTVTYNGQTDNNVDIKDTDTIVVRVEKDGIYSEYTIKLNKKTAYTVKFETYPANAVVRLQDAKKAILSPNADGVYENLLPDTDYTWVVTCKGYVTKTGTLNTPAQLTNGVLSIILSAAPASSLPDY